MQNIVVIFQASDERTEGLALAFGLGAVQRGANIRLRHLDPSPTATLAHQSYGRLQTSDLLWAEGFAVVLEAEDLEGMGELAVSLKELSLEEQAARKWAYVFHAEPAQYVLAMLPPEMHVLPDDRVRRAATPEYLMHMGQTLAEK